MKRRIFIASAALLGMTAHSQVADMNDAINKAGRQRMLSQRMSKAYLALIQKVETSSAQQVLDRSMSTFDRQLVELKAYAPHAEIRDTYAKLENLWSEFKSVLVGTVPDKEHALKLMQLDAKILSLANQGTQQYEQTGGSAVVGKLVNIAGRQRMLSQRMAKLYLANSLQMDAHGSIAEIAKSRGEFIAALAVLRKAPEATPRIKEELALADSQWVFFDLGLSRLEGARSSPKLMSDVFVSSENLLSVMDRITGLYSNLKA
ncbi:MAG: type IV pili methyl-accepting chemotaxis transducer N-terminal domain-containing protein [Pseudomonadota bacterium]|nr:type IV pili methyl-accepting chemotaxis transducer N-terminal domain-containing protein [Pseudomonadota bacterium]